GDNSPFGNSILGTKETLENITIDDVKAFYQLNISIKNTNFYLSGDIDETSINGEMMLFAGWPFVMMPQMPMHKPQAIEKTKIYLVNKENAPQSEIRIGYLALPYDSTGDFYKS